MQQDSVAVGDVPLLPGAEGAVFPGDATGEVERESEGVLGDRLSVGGSTAQNVDAALETGRVVDVGEEVAFDIQQSP